MRHRNTTKTLGRKKASREAMLRNLATSVVLHENVKTTKAKAANNTIHARRELMKVLRTKGAVDKMLDVLGPRYKERPGGYTRATKLGPRQGDGAEMVEVSFV